MQDAWGLVFGPQPVPTGTLRLSPGQTLTWNWGATDNQAGEAPVGEYRVVLWGMGGAAQWAA